MRGATWMKAWPAGAVAVAAMIWTASVFLSDDTGSPWEGPMPSPNTIQPEDADRYAKTLGLDEDQRGFLDALYEVYRAALEETNAKQNVENMTTGPLSQQMTQEESAAYRQRKQAQRAQRNEIEWAFFRDLRLGLNAEQLERWSVLERLHRREQNPVLTSNHIIGWADVVGALHEINPKAIEDETIGGLVQRFEMEDDARRRAAILLREEYWARNGDRTISAANLQALAEQELPMYEATTKRGDIALALLNRLRRLLDQEDGHRLLRACIHIDPSIAERDIDRSLGLDDLTDAQREEILTLRDNHRRRVWPLEEQWLDITIQHQRKGTKHVHCGGVLSATEEGVAKPSPQCQQGELVPDGNGGFTIAPPPDPVEPCPFDQLRDKYSEAHAHTTARLQSALTAAQTKRLADRAQRERLRRALDSAQESLGQEQRKLDWARERGHDTTRFEQSLEYAKKEFEQATKALEAFEEQTAAAP